MSEEEIDKAAEEYRSYYFGHDSITNAFKAGLKYALDFHAGEIDCVKLLEKIKSEGNYKIEISAYPKDSCWTLKAFHQKSINKSCSTSAGTFKETVLKAYVKERTKNDSKND